MKGNRRKLLNLLFLLFTFGVVLYIGLRGNDIEELGAALSQFSPVYFLLCFACWLLYLLTDALSVKFFLMSQGVPLSLMGSIHAAIVGLYYCNITPGASGGQPMEMYTLSKKNVPIGIGGSAMAVKFICFQIILLITGFVMWICNYDFIVQHTQGIKWLVIIGYVVNMFSISGVILMAISRRAMLWVINKCIAVGVKLRLCKDPEASRQKWENHCNSFVESFRMLLKKPLALLAQCAVAFVQLMSLMLVILCIYQAMGLSGITPVQLITIGVLLYISASYTPLPGASGAQEGGFALFFRSVFPSASLFVALLIWRFFTYYLTIIVGAVVTTVESVRGMYKE